MGNWTSNTTKKDATNNASNEIDTLLSKFNAINASKDEFKEQCRNEINQKLFREALENINTDKELKPYKTYEMICAKTPIYVIQKTKINETDIDYNFGKPTYYDVYGSNKKIKQALMECINVDNHDIVPIILSYLDDGEFLFMLKRKESGAMTLSTTEFFIGDALIISNTCSEKSGGGSSMRISDKYDKKLLVYFGWIINELGQWYRYGPAYGHLFGRSIGFDFNSFMKYEINEEKRPPPKKRETICIVGDCNILMEYGCKFVKNVRSGDIIRTSNGLLVKVLCTTTQIINDYIPICKIGECYITPEHPFRYIGQHKWNIPLDVSNIQCTEMYVHSIHNFILESEHYVVVNNVECITLSHMSSDPVIKHPVWGTQLIHTFLKAIPSYPNVMIDDSVNIKRLLDIINKSCN